VAGVVLILAGLGMAGLLVSAHVAQRIYRLLRAVPVTRIRSWVSAHEQAFRNTDDLTRQLLSNLSANAPVPFAWLGASWVMESVESWLLLLVLGVHLGFTEVLAFEPAVSLLRSLAFFLPGGLGVQDAAYLQALQSPSASVVLPPATAAAFVLLKRFKEVFWIVTGFGVLAGMGRARS
jgi:hypothetical protein